MALDDLFIVAGLSLIVDLLNVIPGTIVQDMTRGVARNSF